MTGGRGSHFGAIWVARGRLEVPPLIKSPERASPTRPRPPAYAARPSSHLSIYSSFHPSFLPSLTLQILKSGIPCPLPSPSGPVFYESKLIFSTFLLHSSFLRFLQFLDRFLHPKGPPDPPLRRLATPSFSSFFLSCRAVLAQTAPRPPKTASRRPQDLPKTPQDSPR